MGNPNFIIKAGTPKHPLAQCGKCPYGSQRRFVPTSSPEGADIIVVGEAPGDDELAAGAPFVGASGKILDAMLAEAGADPAKVAKTNTVMCHPGRTGRQYNDPRSDALEGCAPRLQDDLLSHPAKTIITMGKVANEAVARLAGHSFGAKDNMRGVEYEWQGKRVIATYHPAYVARKPSAREDVVSDIRKAVQGPIAHPLQQQPEVRHIETLEQLVAALEQCPHEASVAFDVESDGLQWYRTPTSAPDPLLCLVVTWSLQYGYAINDEVLYDIDGAKEVLNAFFARDDLTFVPHNGKFDVIYLGTIGVKARNDFDTMLAHYALNENAKHDLKGLATAYFGVPDYERVLVKQYLRNSNDKYSKIPYDKLSAYAVWDVCNTLGLKHVFEDELRREGLYHKPFKATLMPLSDTLTKVQKRGMLIDSDYLKRFDGVLARELEEVEAEVRRLANRPELNLASPAQLSDLFWREWELGTMLGWKPEAYAAYLAAPDKKAWKEKNRFTLRPKVQQVPSARVKIGKPPSKWLPAPDKLDPLSTNEDLLAWMADALGGDQQRVMQLLLKHRKVSKMRNAYVVNLLGYADTQGRVHSDPKIHGTEIGRLSFANPALQTIPRPDDGENGEYSKPIRASFVAKPGHVLVIIDVNQSELRTLAHLSEDRYLLGVYDADRDIHTEGAIALFTADYTKTQRVWIKMLNFSWVYGGDENSFAGGTGMPMEQARGIVASHNRLMWRANEWKHETLMEVVKQGYVETVFGRRRRPPEARMVNMDDVRQFLKCEEVKYADDGGAAFRQRRYAMGPVYHTCREAQKMAVHFKVASTSADITLTAMNLVDAKYPYSVLTVHDSLIMEVPEPLADEVGAAGEAAFLEVGRTFAGRVPWKVDVEKEKPSGSWPTRWAPLPDLSQLRHAST